MEYIAHIDNPEKREDYLAHHGILGQKWGIRRYQNPDGSLTDAGKRRYHKDNFNSLRDYEVDKMTTNINGVNTTINLRKRNNTSYDYQKLKNTQLYKEIGDQTLNAYEKYIKAATKFYKNYDKKGATEYKEAMDTAWKDLEYGHEWLAKDLFGSLYNSRLSKHNSITPLSMVKTLSSTNAMSKLKDEWSEMARLSEDYYEVIELSTLRK